MSESEAQFAGLPPAAVAASIFEYWQREQRPVVVLAAENKTAERLFRDLSFFATEAGEDRATLHSARVGLFPAWDVLPFDSLSPSIGVSTARLHSLYLLQHARPIIVATVQSLQQRLLSRQALNSLTITLRVNDEFERGELLSSLIAGGYHRTAVVEEQGQIAVRGSVLDIFPPGTTYPLRIEFFDETIESIRLFYIDSQLSFHSLSSFDVLPVREILVGAELRRLGGQQAISEAVQNIRQRAAEISVPNSKCARIEEAVLEGFYWPGLEHVQAVVHPLTANLFGHLSDDAALCVVEQKSVALEADAFEELIEERATRAEREARLYPKVEHAYFSADEVLQEIERRTMRYYNTLDLINASDLLDRREAKKMAADQAANSAASGRVEKRYQSNARLQQNLQLRKQSFEPLSPLADYIRSLHTQRLAVVLVAATAARQRRLQEILEGYGIDSRIEETTWESLPPFTGAQSTFILRGVLSGGFVDRGSHRAVISEREIFPERKEIVQQKQHVEASVQRILGSLADIKEGEYVVHMDYGIARYQGLCQKQVEGSVGDFLELQYADDAKLYLPVASLGKVQKYAGADGTEPKLTKLGGKVWEKTKSKVQEHVAALAGQLLTTMAKRESSIGFSFGSLSAEDREFADAFPYDETADQARAIEEVLSDMAGSKPMDRLVCGDVGYGKTEVAMRAAFKAVQAGKQVAVVVPTTVLARQHHASFLERFEATAVVVASLSRFNSTQENKRVLAGLAAGKIDVVIGTHRLLQRDVSFHDLGLLIIDEEHRFGVAHKERLKRFRSTIDVLTLSATPIPRTLHMSLVGIRDLSLIETAPVNRQAIRTYLAEYDEAVVREAILRELGRSGQVFLIHNRVQTIEAVAADIEQLVPEARVGIGHGQMKERELESVMHAFINKEIDVLVATTIVESGLDIPNANTIIIRGAEHFGLAETYQLRGRVGRSSRRAYAYLLINNPTSLTREARKRLEVLQSLDDLGVGFKLALQDMEIRGAGNLLGKDQSGSINLIGYELYSRILRDAVEELRARAESSEGLTEKIPDIDPEIKIGFPTHIPPWYLPDVGQRLLLYQRLTEASDQEVIASIAQEAEDRFGVPPPEVRSLLEYMALRCFARQNLIEVLRRTEEGLLIQFHVRQEINAERALALQKTGIRLTPNRGCKIAVPWDAIESPEQVHGLLRPFISDLLGK